MKAVVGSCLAGLACCLPALSLAACPDAADVAAYLADFRAARASKGFGKDIGLADAGCARAGLVARLPQVLGEPVGYKALFTNPDAQRRFGVDGPAWGVMFGGMMLPDGARLPAKFGAIPRFEADFIVVVKDAGLADAETALEALEHIDELVPFIELPDLMLEGKPSGAELIAVNAAFRGGVLGAGIKVEPGQALLDALADMDVAVVERRSGQELGRAKGRALMGQPIDAAIWLAKALKKDGIALKPGDLLSLGGFLASAPTRPGTHISVHYRGLPGDPAVGVVFE